MRNVHEVSPRESLGIPSVNFGPGPINRLHVQTGPCFYIHSTAVKLHCMIRSWSKSYKLLLAMDASFCASRIMSTSDSIALCE
ncbi:hypothetical protein Mapa_013851 [Marchantia paleacea]|nr:hypothetical protein Mapa_013851 [Marchantia paleacea]